MIQRSNTNGRPHRKTSPPSEPRLIRVSSFPEPFTPASPSGRSSKRGSDGGSAARVIRTRREWTEDEDRYLRKHYPQQGAPACARHLGRSKASIDQRVSRLGLHSKRSRSWTAKEDQILRRKYPKVPAARLATMLKRSYLSVRGRLFMLGLTAEGNEEWSRDELAYLRAHAGKASHAELAAELGRTESAVQLKISRMGLSTARVQLGARTRKAIIARLGKKSRPEIARELGLSIHQVTAVVRKEGYIERPTSRKWTPEDEAELRQLFPTMTNEELAEQLNRTIESIMVRSRSLGLYRRAPRGTPHKPWTREEERLLIRLWKKHSRVEIARRLGRTDEAVGMRAKSLGCLDRPGTAKRRS